MAWTDFYCSPGAGGTNSGTLANPWTSIANAITGVGAGPAGSPTRINVLASTSALGAANLTFNTAGTAANPVWWRGYKTSIGDQDGNNTAVAGTDIPAITFTTGQFQITGAHQIFSNLDINGATVAANGLVSAQALDVKIQQCRLVNTAANANSSALSLLGAGGCNGFALVDCYLKATTTANFCYSVLSSTAMTLGNVITGGIIGLSSSTSRGHAISNIFDSQAGDAYSSGSTNDIVIIGNSFYAPLGNGILLTGSIIGPVTIANNYFSTVNQAGKTAIKFSAASTLYGTLVANAYYNCTATISGVPENFAIFDNGVLASEAFANPGSQNFTILPVAYALGFPGKFQNVSLYQGYDDVGAVQHQITGGAVLSRAFTGF